MKQSLIHLQLFILIISILTLPIPFVLQYQSMIPVKSQASLVQKLEMKLTKIGGPTSLASSIKFSSERCDLSPEFVIALMQTESNFKSKAISSKGYKGLMQIPYAVYDPDSNILIGCKIFVEKMRLANGDTIKAICLYKGYEVGTKRGIEQANKVLRLYSELQSMEV